MRNIAANQMLFRQGDPSKYLFEIVSGTLKLSQVAESGQQTIIGFPSSGEIVGLSGAGEYRYDAKTLTAVRLRPARLKILNRQLLQMRLAPEKLMDWINVHERLAEEHIAVLSLQSPLSKLATLLLNQLARQMKANQIKIGRNAGKNIDLPMTQQDIATYLAIAPETCSRTMKKLRADGILETIGRSGEGQLLKILNLQRLRAIANEPFL